MESEAQCEAQAMPKGAIATGLRPSGKVTGQETLRVRLGHAIIQLNDMLTTCEAHLSDLEARCGWSEPSPNAPGDRRDPRTEVAEPCLNDVPEYLGIALGRIPQINHRIARLVELVG